MVYSQTWGFYEFWEIGETRVRVQASAGLMLRSQGLKRPMCCWTYRAFDWKGNTDINILGRLMDNLSENG